MSSTALAARRSTYVSLGVIAWNEEAALGPMLQSLFSQSLFNVLAQRGLAAEVLCVANGCTDRTVSIAQEFFQKQTVANPGADWLSLRVVDLPQRGKLQAWNQFVHTLAAPESRFFFLMDADILLHRSDTLERMLAELENHPEANISVDCPRKDVSFKSRPAWRERLSLAASDITVSGEAQLCAQLYCIRAEVARNIYLPKDLGACEDGFIKQIVCTDFLSHQVMAGRIRVAPGAEHQFEAYTSPTAIFRNQKRQIIGQTLVHVLVDLHLKALPPYQRLRLGETIRERENADPLWLKRLVREHLRKTRYFWRLYPGLLVHRFKTLARLNSVQRLRCLPAALAGSLATLVASYLAYRTLKTGSLHYWPQPQRAGFNPVPAPGTATQSTH